MAHAPRHLATSHGTRVAALLAAAMVAMPGLQGCRSDPPEAALRASVAELEAAVEARDAGALEDLLAGDFVGPGGMDRTSAERLARLSFLRHREVDVALGPLDIAIRDGRAGGMHATVAFTAAMAGGTGHWLPGSGGVYRVETGWRREDGDWVLSSARWERDL